MNNSDSVLFQYFSKIFQLLKRKVENLIKMTIILLN
jgi:hypothetical protein